MRIFNRMFIKQIRCFMAALLLSAIIIACNTKPQSIQTVNAIETSKQTADSITLPVHTIITNDAAEEKQPDSNDYPKTITIAYIDTAIQKVEAFGASRDIWLGPKGFTGVASTGIDGSVVIDLFPQGGGDTSFSFARFQVTPACMGCMMEEGAPFFENARADLAQNFPAIDAMIKAPDSLVLQKKSSTLVYFSYAQHNRARVKGVAFYNPPGTSAPGGFLLAEFALGPGNEALTELLINRFVNMQGLK